MNKTPEGEVFSNVGPEGEVIRGFQPGNETVLAVENTTEGGSRLQALRATPRRISNLEDAEDWSINQSTGNFFGERKKTVGRIFNGIAGSLILIYAGNVIANFIALESVGLAMIGALSFSIGMTIPILVGMWFIHKAFFSK